MKHFLLVLFSVVLFSCGSDKESDPSPQQKTISYRVENRSTTGTVLKIKLFYSNDLPQTVDVQEVIEEITLSKGVYNKTVQASTKYKEVVLSIEKSTTPQQDSVKYRVDYSIDNESFFYNSVNTGYGLSIETQD
jgi:hypothetical protein